MSALERKMKEKYYVTDWWILGPMKIVTMPNDINVLDTRDFSPIKKSFYNARTISWTQTKTPNEISVSDLFKQTPDNTCAFFKTYVHSPKEQTVSMHLTGTDGLRLWVSGKHVWGQAWGRLRNQGRYKQLVCHVPLKEGWNELLIKSYNIPPDEDWKLSLLITDQFDHLIPDLIIDSNRSDLMTWKKD